jgi:hypothetical protein
MKHFAAFHGVTWRYNIYAKMEGGYFGIKIVDLTALLVAGCAIQKVNPKANNARQWDRTFSGNHAQLRVIACAMPPTKPIHARPRSSK